MIHSRWSSGVIAVAIVGAAAPLASAAGKPATDARSAAQVLQREHQYTAAELHGNAAQLASVLADSFVDTSENGVLRDKRQLLRVIAHQRPPSSITESNRRIQIYGDAAVVTVEFLAKGMDHGKPYTAAGRATDVWIRRDGAWLCVAAHSSAIR